MELGEPLASGIKSELHIRTKSLNVANIQLFAALFVPAKRAVMVAEPAI